MLPYLQPHRFYSYYVVPIHYNSIPPHPHHVVLCFIGPIGLPLSRYCNMFALCHLRSLPVLSRLFLNIITTTYVLPTILLNPSLQQLSFAHILHVSQIRHSLTTFRPDCLSVLSFRFSYIFFSLILSVGPLEFYVVAAFVYPFAVSCCTCSRIFYACACIHK